MKDQIEKQAIEEMARIAAKRDDTCMAASIANAIYNAGYRQQEWISVYERLPEKYQDVLVYRDGYVTIDLVCSEGRFILEDVTHWMPIPEPPKMKGGAE